MMNILSRIWIDGYLIMIKYQSFDVGHVVKRFATDYVDIVPRHIDNSKFSQIFLNAKDIPRKVRNVISNKQ